MEVRGDLLAASLSKTQKVCGKLNCICSRGEKHVVYQFSWTENGRRRSTHIRAGELSAIKASVGRYRQLKQCRANLLKITSEGAALIDLLVDALRESPQKKNEAR